MSPERSALDAAKARWAKVGPSSGSYVLNQQVLCFCPTGGTSYTVTVTRGSVAAARNMVTGEAVPASQLVTFRSVEQLFEEVRIALDKPPMLSEVEYDPVAGYPTRLALNSHLRAVDGEVVYISQRIATP